MLFEAPNHKKNILSIRIEGNFVDSNDSFYSFSGDDIVHITFIKKSDGSICEEVRKLIFLEGIDQFFPSDEIELIYRSNYKSVGGYRTFLRKQPLYDEHEAILKKYAYSMHRAPNRDIWDDSPF
jgi:hypothetical protein